jgi:hypothetical protein
VRLIRNAGAAAPTVPLLPPPAAPDLVAAIDALEARLEARLAELVAEAKAENPTLPSELLRNLLLRNESNLFAAMRRLLVERQ